MPFENITKLEAFRCFQGVWKEIRGMKEVKHKTLFEFVKPIAKKN